MFTNAYLLEELRKARKSLDAAIAHVENSTDTKGEKVDVLSQVSRTLILETSLSDAQVILSNLRKKVILSKIRKNEE